MRSESQGIKLINGGQDFSVMAFDLPLADHVHRFDAGNEGLKERLGGRRLRFTDAERRRLARKAQALGRSVLNGLETLVTPDTLLRWYRELMASKWNCNHRRGPGRPRVMKMIVDT